MKTYENVKCDVSLSYKMKSYENVKCDVNIRIKIKNRLFHAWLFGFDDIVQIKQTSNHIRNAVKYCVKTRYIYDKIHNGSK